MVDFKQTWYLKWFFCNRSVIDWFYKFSPLKIAEYKFVEGVKIHNFFSESCHNITVNTINNKYLLRFSSSISLHIFRDWSMKIVLVQTQEFRIRKIIFGTVVLSYPSSLLILLWFIIVCLIKHPVYIMYLYCLQCCNLYQTIIMHNPARPTFVWCWLVKVKEFANGHISLSYQQPQTLWKS